jgi:hypothetical protein
MAQTHRKFWTLLICSLAVTAVLMFACSEKEPTEPEAEAPQIPPLSSFLMDFSDFVTAGSVHVCPEYVVVDVSDSIGFFKTALTQDNYNWAATHVGVWNLIITVGLAVPVAAFVESFAHRPTQQPDGSWIWSYHLTVDGDQYSAALHGSIDNSGTQWEMYITKEGEYENFMWYSGEADLFLTEGTWTLNKHPEDPIPLVGIEWHRDIEDSTADIRYTNIEPGGAENGGYIYYGTIIDSTYDAFYDIYNKGQNNFIDIAWNRTSQDGRVRDAVHFQDHDWHCWDGEHQDIECP